MIPLTLSRLSSPPSSPQNRIEKRKNEDIMQKRFLTTVLTVAAIVACAWGAYPPGYYNGLDGKRQEALKQAAKEAVTSHKKLVYSELPNYWQYSDVYPELYNGQKRWWDMYSNNIYLIRSGETALNSFSRNRMQREHSIPKSWWKKNGDVEYTPAYSDLWNLYPSDGPANQAKLNYAFGVCRSTTFDNGCSKVGPAATGYGGGSGNVFEPADEYKGDFARSIFYMAVVYDDLPWVINYMFRNNSSYPTLQQWAINMLLQWARTDVVSQKEIDRNNAVENSQGNRNPFIDFPELAEYIWGTRTSETFYLSEQGGQITPPVTGDPEVLSPVDGEGLDFSQAAVGQTVSAQLSVRAQNLTANLSLRITGPDAAMFSVSSRQIPSLNLNLGEAYMLNIMYTPTAVGEHSANLTIYDGGLPLGKQINVNLRGRAFPVPDLERLTATQPTNISQNSYTANWDATTQVIDYYVVNRIRYVGNDFETENLTSDTNYLDITDCEPSVLESYTVCSSRLGFLSEPSNMIMVNLSGVVGVQADQPLTIGAVEGGFVVLIDTPHTNLRVVDMAGRTVRLLPTVSGGETILLPAGIYLVSDDQSPAPKKIIVP